MRIQNSLKNMFFGLAGQIVSLVMGFLVRTVFIYTLGVEYLGIEGLFSSVLMLLSLANLGFDTAIIYSLYKPLSENNKVKIQAYMNLYEKAYRIVGIIVLIIGLVLLPFIPYLINGQTNINNINIIYLLFLLSSVSSYFFVYKQSIIIANQQSHIISKIHSIFTLLSNSLQIFLLLVFENYIMVLILQLTFRVVENIYISRVTIKMYPFLTENKKVRLSKDEKTEFFGNLYALLLYKISGVVINGTDNIIISKFVSIIAVGIYSNYLLIISTLNTFLSYLFYSVTASVGNLNTEEDIEKKYFIFRVLTFVNSWIYGFCSVCLWCLINPFINIWLGEQYTFSKTIVFVIVLNFFTTGMQNSCTTYRETTGLFKKGKYRPIFAAVINIVFSIFLSLKLGIAGVILGTVISRLFTYFWYDPYVIYRFVFKRPVWPYFINYIRVLSLVIALALITDFLGDSLLYTSTTNLIIRMILCLIIPNYIMYIFWGKSEEFKYINTILGQLKKKIIMRFSKKVYDV